MTNFDYILLASIWGLILLVVIVNLCVVAYLKKRKKNKEKETKIAGLCCESHNYHRQKWWISKDGGLEKIWMKGQVDVHKIKYFSIYENFSQGFFHSNFIETKKVIFNKTNYANVNQIIKNLKKFNNAIENLWWHKYKPKVEAEFKALAKLTSEADYFFYKYYFIFVRELRDIMVYYGINYIFPSIIALGLKNDLIMQSKKNQHEEYNASIIEAFEKMLDSADTLAHAIKKTCLDEIESKGKEWKSDLKTDQDYMKLFIYDDFLKKIFLREKYEFYIKKNNISKIKNNQKILNILQRKLDNMQEINDEVISETVKKYSN